jgi:hypothetical protein
MCKKRDVSIPVSIIEDDYENLHVRSRSQAVAKYGHFTMPDDHRPNTAAR